MLGALCVYTFACEHVHTSVIVSLSCLSPFISFIPFHTHSLAIGVCSMCGSIANLCYCVVSIRRYVDITCFFSHFIDFRHSF